MVPHYLLILTLAVAASARTASTSKNTVDEPRSSEDTILGDLKVAYETYRDCSGGEIASCLKRKLAKAITRISKNDEVSILSGVTITKDKDAKVNTVEVEEAIPRGLDESSLDNLILDKIVGFMQTHTIQVRKRYLFIFLKLMKDQMNPGRSSEVFTNRFQFRNYKQRW